jgi:hypothetical protein
MWSAEAAIHLLTSAIPGIIIFRLLVLPLIHLGSQTGKVSSRSGSAGPVPKRRKQGDALETDNIEGSG